jgi:NAD(P)-dependent dehydrogenase (short-subunit alcohol dehydrogenase family)
MAERSKVVLITGCSSGIGRATALRLVQSGYKVVATARDASSLEELDKAGCVPVSLDVTSEASMQAAVQRVVSEFGPIGILVNNAGYSQSGAVESVPIDKVRKQFETNVFGLLRLTQLVLPGMRERGWGKVVNVGSMGGRLTFPGGGVYHATKYALEALSDALRFEVAGFGIDVILVQPGLIRTGFAEAVSREMSDVPSQSDGPYSAFNAAVQKATAAAYSTSPMARFGGSPEDVAAAIEAAIGRERSPSRVPVTPSARLLMGMRSWMSDRLWDRFVAGSFPRPGR